MVFQKFQYRPKLGSVSNDRPLKSGTHLKGVVILQTISPSGTPPVVPYTAPDKSLWPDETDASYDRISMNLFGWVGLADTEDPAPFLL